ncbi:MAG: RluA family pseudouridine synthase [Clostridia bacterium]
MKNIQLQVVENGIRIDAFISKECPEISRSYVQKLIETGCISVNGIKTISKYKVKTNDLIQIELPIPVNPIALPEDIAIDVLYEDDQLLVVNKAKGMVVHPAAGNTKGTLVNALLSHCTGRLSDINGVVRPGIVHRIDKDTSGILVVTKTNAAHAYFSEKFKNHDIQRTYYAIVDGVIQENAGKIDAPIGRNQNDRKKMAVNTINGKSAITHFEVVERFHGYTYIKVNLETGRTHQIRVHLAYIGHPLVGDHVYGRKKQPFTSLGQALHAGVLGFNHPVTKEYMEFHVKPPKEFDEIIEKIRVL